MLKDWSQSEFVALFQYFIRAFQCKFLVYSLQESEGDEEGEGEDEIDDEVEDDAENESGAAAGTDEAPAKPEAALPPVVREPERQLSKKEIKKKELADLEAVLAQFKMDQTEEKEENGAFLTIMADDHVIPIHSSLSFFEVKRHPGVDNTFRLSFT